MEATDCYCHGSEERTATERCGSCGTWVCSLCGCLDCEREAKVREEAKAAGPNWCPAKEADKEPSERFYNYGRN